MGSQQLGIRGDCMRNLLVNKICKDHNLEAVGPIDENNYRSIFAKLQKMPYVYGVFEGTNTCIHIGKSEAGNWSRAKNCFRITRGKHNKSLLVANFRKAHPRTYLVIFKDRGNRSVKELEEGIKNSMSSSNVWLPVYNGYEYSSKELMTICSLLNNNGNKVSEFCKDFSTESDMVSSIPKLKKYLDKEFLEEFINTFGSYYNT
jgi:hypothetical protein